MADEEKKTDNLVAPDGQVWVCVACGKRSRDQYGEQAINHEWDVSCTMNAVLCDEKSLVIENGRVVHVQTEDPSAVHE